MRVLVTGATGFIGSHVARVLVRQGHDVHAMLRHGADTWRIADLLDSLFVARGDVGAPEHLEPALARIRPEVCFHLAWYAVPGKYLMAVENLDMLRAGIVLAQRLADVGCKTLIVAGTCFEYDTDFGFLSESAPTRPRNLYAASKLALHLAVSHWASLVGLRVVWPRLFYQYGPYEDERRLVPSVILSLLRKRRFRALHGSQALDYLYVGDVAVALACLMDSDLQGAVNIGSGRPVAIRELVQMIAGELGCADLVDVEDRTEGAPGPAFVCADTRLLRSQTSWRPQIALEEGLLQTIAWWKTQLEGSP